MTMLEELEYTPPSHRIEIGQVRQLRLQQRNTETMIPLYCSDRLALYSPYGNQYESMKSTSQSALPFTFTISAAASMPTHVCLFNQHAGTCMNH